MPNSAYLHLMLNHIPEIGTAALFIIAIYAFSAKNDKLMKFIMLLVVLLSLVTIVVFISGNNAEGSVKGLEGVIEDNIEPHQDFATKSFLFMEVLGAFSLAGLLLFRAPKLIPRWFRILIISLMFVVNGMMLYTAHLGGKIFHQEIINSVTKPGNK